MSVFIWCYTDVNAPNEYAHLVLAYRISSVTHMYVECLLLNFKPVACKIYCDVCTYVNKNKCTFKCMFTSKYKSI